MYTEDTTYPLPWGKLSGYEADHSNPSGAEIKNTRKYISNPFMYIYDVSQ
jgi:hypothetical protein